MDKFKNLPPYKILFFIAPVFALVLWNVETYIEFVNTAIKWDKGWIGIRLSLFVAVNGFIYWLFRDVFAKSTLNQFHLKWILGSCILTTLLMLYSKYFSVELNDLEKPFILLMLAFLISLLILVLNLFFSLSKYVYNRDE